MNSATPTRGPSQPARHRVIVLTFMVLSLIVAWCYMAAISRNDPWYRNADMNIHNMVDALAINSDLAPNPFAQPGVPLKYLLALDYRLRHYSGDLAAWNIQKLGASSDPLKEIARLVRIERVHSRALVIALIIAAAGLTYSVTRKIESACFSVILLCGSAGLLFQGLLARPELLCVGFGNVLALWCTWHATTTSRWKARHAWLFLAGVLGGLATLEKLPGICYVALCYGWCWLSALISPGEKTPVANIRDGPGFWSGLLPVFGSASVLWLLFQLEQFHDDLGPVVLWRLRVAAFGIAALPLLALWHGRHRAGDFLIERLRELALLGGGALAALALGYLLLRGVMSEQPASAYMTGVLHFLANPAPYMETFLAGKNEPNFALSRSLKETPLLFSSAVLIAIGVWFVRSLPIRLKAFTGLLLAAGLGMTYLMSKRHFAEQYSIFPQVPLMLVWALGLHALTGLFRPAQPSTEVHWVTPLAIATSFILMLAVYLQLQPKYHFYQDDARLPVSDLTITFLFDHDAHLPAYRDVMKAHYENRENFAKTLEQYLSEASRRY